MKVVELYDSNFRDVPKTLRVIADQIEAGGFGDVRAFALALQAGSVEIFGGGPESTADRSISLFAEASNRLRETIFSA